MTGKIRVAFVIAGFAYPDSVGGAELFTEHLSRALAKNDIEVHLIAAGRYKFKSGCFADVYRHAIWAGTRWYHFGLSYILFTINALVHLLKIRPDVCVAVMEHSATPCILYRCIARKPVILRWAGSDYFAIRYYLLKEWSKTIIKKPNLPIKDILLYLFLLMVAKHNVYHIVLSRDMLEILLGCKVRRTRVQLIPNFINEEFFAVTPSVGDCNIIFVGRLEEQKGIDLLFKAFIEVEKEIPKAKLFLIGDGSQRQLLMDWGKRFGVLDSMIITGFVSPSKIVELLQKASVFVLPSRFEGLPNALLQAMAAGLPIVATNVGGIPDVIDDGLNGVLVPPENVKALAQSIKYLIVNKEVARKLGENARRKAFRFKMDNIVEQYIKMFKKLAHQPS